MALKLEELINKKKEPNQILDLSRVKIKTQEEFEKYFDKIPEYKIRPEKVRQEDIRIRDTDARDTSFTFTKKEAKWVKKHEFPYGDPCPPSMKTVRLEDLAAVDISWRMLTMLRPKNRLEEDIFSRLVDLGKLRLATRNLEAKQLASAGNGAPGTQSNAIMASMGIIVCKSKRGGTETRIITCKECGVELCTGAFCKEFPYESYTRMILDKDELEGQDLDEVKGQGSKGDQEVGRRGSKLNKTKGVSPGGAKAPKSKPGLTKGNTGGGGNKSIANRVPRLKKKRKKKKKSKKKIENASSCTDNNDSDDDYDYY